MNNRGFTLLELLVAIAVFTLMAAASYGGFNVMLTNKQQIEEQADALSRLQMAFVIMQRDLEQMIHRPIRDEYGEVKAAVINDDGDILLEFTRSGVNRLFSDNQSNLQRIAYKQDDDKLIRLSWDVLDRAQDTRPVEQVLLAGIKAIAFHSIIAEDDVSTQVNLNIVAPLTERSSAAIIPDGIELTLDMNGFGNIKRLFLIRG